MSLQELGIEHRQTAETLAATARVTLKTAKICPRSYTISPGKFRASASPVRRFALSSLSPASKMATMLKSVSR